MFTGIVEERGRVDALAGSRLEVSCQVVDVDSPIGSSLAVNGVCLTVISNQESVLAFDLSEETLARTSLRRLRPGDPVNLERPMSLSARLGGHIVQGHVDGVGIVESLEPESPGAAGMLLKVGVPPDLRGFIVEKGSIAVDGISLTVASLSGTEITVAVIPHTLSVTTLGEAMPGDPVNLEVDVIARYVAQQVHSLMEGSEA
jgi:riboflavin synthase